jgi:hypothetical protein
MAADIAHAACQENIHCKSGLNLKPNPSRNKTRTKRVNVKLTARFSGCALRAIQMLLNHATNFS